MFGWDLSFSDLVQVAILHRWKTTLPFFCFEELCRRSQWNELALRTEGERPGVFILCIFRALFLLGNTSTTSLYLEHR